MKLPAPSLTEDPDKDLPGALHEVSNALTVVLGWLETAKSRAVSIETRDALDVAISHARANAGEAKVGVTSTRGLLLDGNVDAILGSLLIVRFGLRPYIDTVCKPS